MKHLLTTTLAIFATSAIFAGVPLVKPERIYPDIAKGVVNQISTNHLSGERFDAHLSAVAWTNLLNALDYDHSLLTQEDVQKYEPNREQIGNMIAKGDLSFGYAVSQLVRERLEERFLYTQEILKQETPFDFTLDDTYVWQRSKAERPANRAEQLALWRTMLKNDYLILTLNKEFEAEEELAKTPEQKAKEAELKAAETTYSSDDDLKAPVAEIISKRDRTLRDAYLEMDSETVFQRYLSAVANAYDPHTDYMSPMNYEEFSMDMNLVLCGIGATLRYEDGMIRIMEIMPGSPAAMDTREVRLREGDRIIGVGQGDGAIEDIRHKPLNRTIRKIRGEKGTKVVLKVIPATDPTGMRTKIVDLIRDEIKLDEQAVTGRVERITMPSGETYKFGYARVPGFYADTSSLTGGGRSMTADLLEYIKQFNADHVDGLIVDLRNNGGGSLLEALMMNGLFVSGPVVQVKDKRTVVALPSKHPVAFRKPMVVLVNRTSASASEIVAAALQDYGRAIIIGDSKTHGKGTVQTVMSMGNDKLYGANRITTACFYRINGGTTQLRGVIPDVILPSIYDTLDIGEDKLPCALPYSEVDKAYYVKTDDLGIYMKRLKELSEARLQKDKQYQDRKTLISHIRENNSKKTVSLNMDSRRARMRDDRALQKVEDQEMMPAAKKRKLGPQVSTDPVLREACNILGDFIELRGGRDEPVNVNGDLGSQLFRIFGR